MMIRNLLIVLSSLFFIAQSFAADYEVDTAGELTTALANVTAGQTIHIIDGTYNNWGNFTTSVDGTSGNEITIYADTKGGVTFTGNFSLTLSNDYYIIEKLVFDGVGANTPYWVIRLKATAPAKAENNRITNNTFDSCGNSSYSYYATIQPDPGSHNNRIDNNLFEGGEAYVIRGNINSAQDFPTHYTIDNNTFQNVTQGYTMVGVGSGNGHTGAEATHWIIEYNTITNCGDGAGRYKELLIAKTSYNIFRYNTLTDNEQGCLSLRRGAYNEVYGNTFINATIGINVHGYGHEIYNNMFYRIGTGIRMMWGDMVAYDHSGAPSQMHTHDCVIAYNTSVKGTNYWNGGSWQTAQRLINEIRWESHPNEPTTNTIVNNLIRSDYNYMISSIGDGVDDCSENTVENNLFDSVGDQSVTGVVCGDDIEQDANLSASDETARLTTASTYAINAAIVITDFSNLVDIDEDVRAGGTDNDIGADEYGGDQAPALSIQGVSID